MPSRSRSQCPRFPQCATGGPSGSSLPPPPPPLPSPPAVASLLPLPAAAVSPELPYHAVTMRLRHLLDRRPHVPEPPTGPHLRHASLQAPHGNVQQLPGRRGDLPDRVRVAGVADPAAERSPHVDADHVPAAQLSARRDAVDDLLVYRGADGAGEGRHRGRRPVALVGRLGAVVEKELLDGAVDL